jgi:hypothetical protein
MLLLSSHQGTSMSIKKPLIGLGAGALLLAAGALPVSAQYAPGGECIDMYNRTMAAYQYNPQSAQYADLLNQYSGRCLSGSSAAPAYSPGYAQPYYAQPVDPGAAIVGGIIGGALSGALRDDRDWRGDRYGYRHRDDRRRY